MRHLNTNFTLGNCLFVFVKHTGYSTWFDSRSEFLHTDGSYGNNVIIFGANMTSSAHVDNTGKDILILGEGPTH